MDNHRLIPTLLYSALLGTLSLAVQPIVARATTSREIWDILFRTYGKPSRGHIKQVRQQLKHNNKENKSINEYMRGIIEKADQLALLGSPLEHEDLPDYITKGLGEDYRAIVEMVNGRDTPITIDELHEKLINRENTLKTTTTSDSNMPVTANPTNVRTNQSTNSFNSSRGGSNSNRGVSRQSRPYLGKCQICGVQGHGARRCPHYQQYPTHMAPGVHQQYGQQQSQPRGHASWLAPHLPLPTPQWQQQAHHATMSSPNFSR